MLNTIAADVVIFIDSSISLFIFQHSFDGNKSHFFPLVVVFGNRMDIDKKSLMYGEKESHNKANLSRNEENQHYFMFYHL